MQPIVNINITDKSVNIGRVVGKFYHGERIGNGTLTGKTVFIDYFMVTAHQRGAIGEK